MLGRNIETQVVIVTIKNKAGLTYERVIGHLKKKSMIKQPKGSGKDQGGCFRN